MKLKHLRRECEILPPWYYGLAYHDIMSDTSIFYPIPLNFIVRWARYAAYQWDKMRGQPTNYLLLTRDELQRLQKEAYERGRAAERKFGTRLDEDVMRYIGRIMEIT